MLCSLVLEILRASTSYKKDQTYWISSKHVVMGKLCWALSSCPTVKHSSLASSRDRRRSSLHSVHSLNSLTRSLCSLLLIIRERDEKNGNGIRKERVDKGSDDYDVKGDEELVS